MREETQEIVGLLCRWTLLGGTAATVAGIAALCLTSAGGAASGPSARLTVPDGIRREGGSAHLTGYCTPTEPGRSPPAALSSGADGRLRLVPTIDSRVYPRPGSVHPRANRVRIVGVPYSRYAFARSAALLWVVPHGGDACLIDARLAPDADGDGPRWAPLRTLTAALQTRGLHPALFRPGPTAGYESFRLRVRRALGEVAVLQAPPGEDGALGILLRARGRLDARRRPLTVVTADAALARAAAERGFATHLIGEASPREHLRTHASVEATAMHFRGSPDER